MPRPHDGGSAASKMKNSDEALHRVPVTDGPEIKVLSLLLGTCAILLGLSLISLSNDLQNVIFPGEKTLATKITATYFGAVFLVALYSFRFSIATVAASLLGQAGLVLISPCLPIISSYCSNRLGPVAVLLFAATVGTFTSIVLTSTVSLGSIGRLIHLAYLSGGFAFAECILYAIWMVCKYGRVGDYLPRKNTLITIWATELTIGCIQGITLVWYVSYLLRNPRYWSTPSPDPDDCSAALSVHPEQTAALETESLYAVTSYADPIALYTTSTAESPSSPTSQPPTHGFRTSRSVKNGGTADQPPPSTPPVHAKRGWWFWQMLRTSWLFLPLRFVIALQSYLIFPHVAPFDWKPNIEYRKDVLFGVFYTVHFIGRYAPIPLPGLYISVSAAWKWTVARTALPALAFLTLWLSRTAESFHQNLVYQAIQLALLSFTDGWLCTALTVGLPKSLELTKHKMQASTAALLMVFSGCLTAHSVILVLKKIWAFS